DNSTPTEAPASCCLLVLRRCCQLKKHLLQRSTRRIHAHRLTALLPDRLQYLSRASFVSPEAHQTVGSGQPLDAQRSDDTLRNVARHDLHLVSTFQQLLQRSQPRDLASNDE